MDLLDIKKYFGRRGNEQGSIEIEDEIKKEAPMKIRGDRPGTTTFNRKLVIGLTGLLALVFALSLIFGLSKPAPDKQREESEFKDKKITAGHQTNSQLDKLPSTYDAKKANTASTKPDNASLKPPIPDNSNLPPRQPISNNLTPPIPTLPPGVGQQGQGTPAIPGVAPAINKEEQELADARKSPIRFNLK